MYYRLYRSDKFVLINSKERSAFPNYSRYQPFPLIKKRERECE